MMRVAAFLLLTIVVLGCQSDSSEESPTPQRPSWMKGTWTGRLAWEHDTTSHRLRLDLNEERFVYPALGCRGTLQIDSTRSDRARMRLVAAHDSLQCGEVSGGIAELHRLDEPSRLHLQYWPQNSTKLYLAQLQPLE